MDAGEEWTGVEWYLYLDIKLSIMASSADQVSNCKVLISTFVGGSRLNDTTRAFRVPWYSAITTKLPSEINGLTNQDINPTISFTKIGFRNWPHSASAAAHCCVLQCHCPSSN